MCICVYTHPLCVCMCVYCRGRQRKRWLIASLTQWTWIWTNSGRYWGTEELDMLQFMGLQRVRLDWATDQKYVHIYAAAKSLQSCPTLCDPTDGSLPGSPVPGILQARTLEWVAISFSSAWKCKVKVKSLSRVRLSDPMDCSPPGSSTHGISQARVLEWVPLPSPIHIYTYTHICACLVAQLCPTL